MGKGGAPTPSPFLMNAPIRHHLLKYPETDWVAKDVADSMYSDNLTSGVDTEEQGLQYYEHSKLIFSEAGMNLRKWMSNSKKLQDKFYEDGSHCVTEAKLLGLLWNTHEDTFKIISGCILDSVENVKLLTKRMFCSVTAKVFDPFGFVEPFMIRGKMIMQELWKLSLEWDEIIPEVQHKSAQDWIKEIRLLTEYRINRSYFSSVTSEIRHAELHVFSDSSQKGYGAVCYIRAEIPDDQEIQHVLAKSRVAPLKEKTIPKLELMAAVLARYTRYTRL